ncbi:PaREP1 family protein [Vulcanisaeta sp. JCM 14467]|uniref:PaREP1 family protein n=1 Tax=Vulcanisaeta sp. JCM 14467 TaxID=1295370 RepID=UPI0006D289AA|nr:PaREP1 family protein [Vulcanisaeta sp. JCM 14467]
MCAETIEKPLSKPTSEDYVNARLLESLVEASLAVKFLEDGLVRNAAGKVFQAWRALLAALLKLELDKLLKLVRSDEERQWLINRAVPRVPTSRMKALSQMLEEIGHRNMSAWTSIALDLHDYQHNGPDPDMAVSKYRNREEAAIDIKLLINELVRRVEELKPKVRWGDELENALKTLREGLGRVGGL